MAIHIYMSVGKMNAEGKFIDTQTGEETLVMRHRGEVSVGDDPVSFKEMMEKKGHIVELHNDVVGDLVERSDGKNSVQKSYEYIMGEM